MLSHLAINVDCQDGVAGRQIDGVAEDDAVRTDFRQFMIHSMRVQHELNIGGIGFVGNNAGHGLQSQKLQGGRIVFPCSQ